ncbi:ABC transporter ATP-binding protein, partial [bacterium]|nr:ABC transporter ATP-binding protein [bacterium]
MYKKRIGVVEDTSNLFPDLTVYENLLFKARAFGVNYRTIRKKIMNYLEMFNLSNKVKSKFLSLSRGQKRIVSIVCSLLHSPEVLFLDEPTLGLDINVRNRVHQLLLQLNKQKNVTIFLTSHYFEEVEKLCNRISVINKGSLIFDGDINKLKTLFPGDKVISVELTIPINEAKASKYFTHFKIKENKLFIAGYDVALILEKINKFVKDNKLKIKEINTEGNKLEDL